MQTIKRYEALKLLRDGKTVAHKFFLDDEYIFLRNGQVISEDGVNHGWASFWEARDDEAWLIDWQQVNFRVLSPDAITIECVEFYDTIDAANKALDAFVNRYTIQGYYSSNNGRIPLNEIKANCKIYVLKVSSEIS